MSDTPTQPTALPGEARNLPPIILTKDGDNWIVQCLKDTDASREYKDMAVFVGVACNQHSALVRANGELRQALEKAHQFFSDGLKEAGLDLNYPEDRHVYKGITKQLVNMRAALAAAPTSGDSA